MGLVLREKGDEARLIVKLEVIWISQGVIIWPNGNIWLESFFSHIPEFEFKKKQYDHNIKTFLLNFDMMFSKNFTIVIIFRISNSFNGGKDGW